MGYSNSKLVSYTKLSPNHSGQRTHKIDRITPHCVVGQLSCESIAGCFPAGREASCNYGIGNDGRISLIVEEKNRSWCSSSNANDQRAITIECASDMSEPYAMNNVVYKSLVALCVDICKRNGKNKILWFGNKDKSLNYKPKNNEMVITVHRWFANKSCPGDWLYNRLDDLATEVNKKLDSASNSTSDEDDKKGDGVLYRVQVGAYSKKTNAEAQLAKVKKKGFDTYMVTIDNLFKIQIGAYSNKSNADAMLKKLKDAGFDAFITTQGGKAVTAKKSITEVAKEVLNGQWGNGQDRIDRLTKAGYDAKKVQSVVNKLCK